MIKFKSKASILSVSLFCLLYSGVEGFSTQVSSRLNFDPLPMHAPKITDAGQELAPIAFVKFCLHGGVLCEQANIDKPLELTAQRWQQIQDVNQMINARITPDPTKGGYDWSLETNLGNCNDYAVQKQNALVELGFPLAALALTVAVTPWGEGHLVLTVRTDRGDFVLDNLRESVLAWNKVQYRWIKRQSAQNTQQWVGIAATNQQTASLTRRNEKIEQPSKPRKSEKKLPSSEQKIAGNKLNVEQNDNPAELIKPKDEIAELRLVYFSDLPSDDHKQSKTTTQNDFSFESFNNETMRMNMQLRL